MTEMVRTRTYVWLITTVLLCLVPPASNLAVADNLIKNGTFDKDADGWVNQPQGQPESGRMVHHCWPQ